MCKPKPTQTLFTNNWEIQDKIERERERETERQRDRETEKTREWKSVFQGETHSSQTHLKLFKHEDPGQFHTRPTEVVSFVLQSVKGMWSSSLCTSSAQRQDGYLQRYWQGLKPQKVGKQGSQYLALHWHRQSDSDNGGGGGGFSLDARIFREGSSNHSLPALFFFFKLKPAHMDQFHSLG